MDIQEWTKTYNACQQAYHKLPDSITYTSTGGCQNYQFYLAKNTFETKVVPPLTTNEPTTMPTEDIKLLNRELDRKGYTERERKFLLAFVMANPTSAATILYNMAKVEALLEPLVTSDK